MRKNSFTLLELILVIVLISILYTSFKLNTKNDNKLEEISKRLELQLKYLRYKALVDSKNSYEQENWYKKRWTLKFFRCNKNVGGIYYSIYSDENMLGHPNKIESLKDPLSKKYIYNSNSCVEKDDISKYTLLTKNYNIERVELTCNETTSLGQISIGNKGDVYTRLTNDDNTYKLKENCKIKLINFKNQTKEIEIKKETSYIKIEK